MSEEKLEIERRAEKLVVVHTDSFGIDLTLEQTLILVLKIFLLKSRSKYFVQANFNTSNLCEALDLNLCQSYTSFTQTS